MQAGRSVRHGLLDVEDEPDGRHHRQGDQGNLRLRLMVAMLSVTGIVIWERKRRSRRLQASREAAAQCSTKPMASGKTPVNAR